MSFLKRVLTKIASEIETKLDLLSSEIKERLGLYKPLQIVTYRSYGTKNRLYIKGRVLENKGIGLSTDKDTVFHNLLNMYKRFESDEVPGAQLKVRFQGAEHIMKTDEEGYFLLYLITETEIKYENMWQQIEVELIDAPIPYTESIKATAEILFPQADAEYGIISDIDDTIIQTSATSLLAMSRNTFLHNAHTRLPFAGVSEFYKSLQLGRNGKRNNPFFYVSSSPWNLYDLLIDFLDLNDIPHGPLLLRDFGLQENKLLGTDHMGHKFQEIKNILLTYPDLKFVLIGDSGQEDPVIYKEVVKRFPDRILAIYIRDVQLADRESIAIKISKELEADKVEMIVVDNTVEASEHAAKIGLIFTEAIPNIVEDKKMDKGEIPGKEALKT